MLQLPSGTDILLGENFACYVRLINLADAALSNVAVKVRQVLRQWYTHAIAFVGFFSCLSDFRRLLGIVPLPPRSASCKRIGRGWCCMTRQHRHSAD